MGGGGGQTPDVGGAQCLRAGDKIRGGPQVGCVAT